MKQGLTELVFVLDRSGSMRGLAQDAIGGFNGLIEKQRAEAGEARVTAVLFDDAYEMIYNNVDINEVPPLTDEVYYPRGVTALLDAVGKTIDSVGERLAATPEAERPEKVVFVITTDGLENASCSYTVDRVKEMIEHQKNKYSWEFLFYGAGIDAVRSAGAIGIAEDRAVRVKPDSAGIRESYCLMAEFISEVRAPRDETATSHSNDATGCKKKNNENK